MHYKVPINNGELDIDYVYLMEAIQVSDSECYVKMRDDAVRRDSWQEITEEEFEAVKPPIPEPVLAETTDQKLARLEQDNLILMDALATVYEELLNLQSGGAV